MFVIVTLRKSHGVGALGIIREKLIFFFSV